MKIVSLRIPDTEHAAMMAAAEREFITLSGLVRREMHRYLHQSASGAGANPVGLAQSAKPAYTPPQRSSDELADSLDSLFDDEPAPGEYDENGNPVEGFQS